MILCRNLRMPRMRLSSSSAAVGAKTLTEKSIRDFKIIEVRDGLGGCLHSEMLGEPGQLPRFLLWVGANWIQGIGGGEGEGPENLMWTKIQYAT